MRPEPVRIEMLGGLRVRLGDRTLEHFESRKAGALLGCLALHVGRRQSRDALAESLWPDEDFEATRARLRQVLSCLRRDLEALGESGADVVLADRAEAWVDPRSVSTDVADFQAAAQAASRCQEPCERAQLLRRAVELYRGELLPAHHEECFAAFRQHFEVAYRDVLASLADALTETGDAAGATGIARRALEVDPLREDAACRLMRLYASAGRVSDALRVYQDLERALREELGTPPSAATRGVLDWLRAEARRRAPLPNPDPVPGLSGAPRSSLEPEGGAVPLGSPFYVARPADEAFDEALARHDSIVLVKGPRQVGKTSLLARGLKHARDRGDRVVMTDLQKLTDAQVGSADIFSRMLAEGLVEQLEMDVSLEAHWASGRAWNLTFERFLRREVLGRSDGPVVWALDEMDRLFRCPFHDDVFALFRSWHNERSLDPEGPWSRLTLAIAYATEAHLFINDLNQSPFNVGTRLALGDFTRGEVAELNRLYGSPLAGEEAVSQFYALVGGNPYLVRRGLHTVVATGCGIAELDKQADRDDGPFGDHLRRMLYSLTRDAELCSAATAVLRGQPCPTVEALYRLRSAGVLLGDDERHVTPRCELYRRYLTRHLL